MEIKIDEEVLKTYVEKTVNKKIESLTDDIIKEKVYDALLGKVDSILSAYKNDIKYLVEKHVKAYIKEICPTVDKKIFEDVGKSIARSIAWELRDDVMESIAYRLMPDNEEESEDE